MYTSLLSSADELTGEMLNTNTALFYTVRYALLWELCVFAPYICLSSALAQIGAAYNNLNHTG